MEDEDEELVAEADAYGVEDVGGRGLFGGGLELVERGEAREEGVEGEEEGAGEPPEEELDEERAGEVDGDGVVG